MRERPNSLDKGREPVVERKRLGAVAAEIDALVVLEEAEVEPRDEPPELDLVGAVF